MTEQQQQVFAERALAWFDKHGRKHLPWQQDVTPYKVGVGNNAAANSSHHGISTKRFMASFPTVHDLSGPTTQAIIGLGLATTQEQEISQSCEYAGKKYNGEFPIV